MTASTASCWSPSRPTTNTPDRLIKEFDQPIESLTPLERRLRYVFVDQVLPVLVDVLQDTGSGTSTLAGGAIVRSKRPPQASSDPATLAGRPRRGPLQREGATTAPVGYEDQLTPPEENAAPLSVLVGKTRLVADVQANKLIAYGPPGDIAKITSLLTHLDKKPPQVYLATIIGQLSLDDGLEFGVDYLREFKAGGEGDYAGAHHHAGVAGASDQRHPQSRPSRAYAARVAGVERLWRDCRRRECRSCAPWKKPSGSRCSAVRRSTPPTTKKPSSPPAAASRCRPAA